MIGAIVLLLLDEARGLAPDARRRNRALRRRCSRDRKAQRRLRGLVDDGGVPGAFGSVPRRAPAPRRAVAYRRSALALLVSIPLGWLAFRHPRFRAGVHALLNGVQVVPAVALFGLLVSLLSFALAAWSSLRGLGLAAIGPTPALIGVAAYLMLPLTRGVATGLAAADPGRDRDGSRHGDDGPPHRLGGPPAPRTARLRERAAGRRRPEHRPDDARRPDRGRTASEPSCSRAWRSSLPTSSSSAACRSSRWRYWPISPCAPSSFASRGRCRDAASFRPCRRSRRAGARRRCRPRYGVAARRGARRHAQAARASRSPPRSRGTPCDARHHLRRGRQHPRRDPRGVRDPLRRRRAPAARRHPRCGASGDPADRRRGARVPGAGLRVRTDRARPRVLLRHAGPARHHRRHRGGARRGEAGRPAPWGSRAGS